MASEDKKYKCKMNRTAVNRSPEQKYFSIIAIEGFFGTRMIVKYLCMSEAAVLDKEKIHNPSNDRLEVGKHLFNAV